MFPIFLLVFHFKSYTLNLCVPAWHHTRVKKTNSVFLKKVKYYGSKKNKKQKKNNNTKILSNATSFSFLYSQQSGLVITLLHCVFDEKSHHVTVTFIKTTKGCRHIKSPQQKGWMSYFDWGHPETWQTAAVALPHSCLHTTVPLRCWMETSGRRGSGGQNLNMFTVHVKRLHMSDFGISVRWTWTVTLMEVLEDAFVFFCNYWVH